MSWLRNLFGGAPEVTKSGPQPSLRVLVAETSLTVAKVIELALQDATVTTATTVQQAKAALANDRPSLVITGVAFPDGDGYALCKAVTTDPFHRCPVIVLHGSFEVFDEARAREAGASAILTKPFNPADLVAAVHNALTA